MNPPTVRAIDVRELKGRLDAGERPFLLDVREREEVELAALAGAKHIPMGEIPSRLGELDPDAEIVVICHHGMRSANVAGYLAEHGFARIGNLTGGIDAWSRLIDPSVPRY